MEEKQIRAVYTNETVRVYQAYSKIIAEEAIKLNRFGPSFKLSRMTWIKPSFLWMMYRCGWGTKDKNQEHILAIDIKREAFDYIVKNAVESKKPKFINKNGKSNSTISTNETNTGTNEISNLNSISNSNISDEEWKEKIKNSDIRVQWDPERDIYGKPLNYRSIQLGLRGKAVEKYVNEWIVHIEDITSYVQDLNQKKNSGIDILHLLPEEKVYIVQ